MGNKNSRKVKNIVQNSELCKLPGEIVSLIGRFAHHECLLNFFLIHRNILPELTRNGFFDFKCRDLGITVDGDKSRITFEKHVKHEVYTSKFMFYEIAKMMYGDHLYFHEFNTVLRLDGDPDRNAYVQKLGGFQVEVSDNSRRITITQNSLCESIPITMTSPNFQFCLSMKERVAVEERMDESWMVEFRLHVEDAESLKKNVEVGFLATDMGGYRQKSTEYNMLSSEEVGIKSGQLLKLSYDNKSDIIRFCNGQKQEFEYSGKEGRRKHNLTPSYRDLMIFRLLIKLEKVGDALEIVRVRRVTIPREQIYRDNPCHYEREKKEEESRRKRRKKK